MSSSDRVALVTGAASGIGRATTELFRSRSISVLAVDRVPLPYGDGDDNLVSFVGDLTQAESNAGAVELACTRFGRLDTAVLNIGMPMSGEIEGYDLELFDRGFNVNVRSVVLGLQAALPALRASGAGSVVVTGSISGLGGDPRRWAYSAAKAAVLNLVQSVALDLAPKGVRINAVCPGPIATGMVEPMRQHEPERYEYIRRLVPMQRWGRPEEVAQVIAFLASAEAAFVTGVWVPVDGGAAAMSGNYRPPVDG
jgi:meso-butanediol dehydrogenase / (S,S)-butanediol dehydrogenase / diacetyl reductase